MTQQPKALRLADSLWALMSTTYSNGILEESVAELRRLYAVNKKLIDTLEEISLNSPDPTDRSFARYVLNKVED